MSGANAGTADGGGWQNRWRRTAAADSYRRRQTATDDGGPKEAGQRWRAAVAWMAANGSGGIKMNVGRMLRILFFAQDLPVVSFFFARGFARGSRQKHITNKQNPGRFARGKKKDSVWDTQMLVTIPAKSHYR
jgi:hypothetical protein